MDREDRDEMIICIAKAVRVLLYRNIASPYEVADLDTELGDLISRQQKKEHK